MSEPLRVTDRRHGAGGYEIRVQGHLDARWVAWFDGLDIAHGGDGITVIQGQVADQAALHGLLQKVRDTGLPLVAVIRVDADASDQQPMTDRHKETI